MRVAIYTGARAGSDSIFADHATATGRLLATAGMEIVYGGGSKGLMGLVARAALAVGGKVIGVTERHIASLESATPLRLTELFVTESMTARRRTMFELSDAVVAMPGGIGTLEELFEVWSWRHLRLHRKPVFLLNTSGFWTPLLTWVEELERSGFVRGDRDLKPVVCNDPSTLVSTIAGFRDHADQSTTPLNRELGVL